MTTIRSSWRPASPRLEPIPIGALLCPMSGVPRRMVAGDVQASWRSLREPDMLSLRPACSAKPRSTGSKPASRGFGLRLPVSARLSRAAPARSLVAEAATGVQWPRRARHGLYRDRLLDGGFTILELLVAMSMFAILGIAVVSLLGQGLNLFTSGTADTTMQDRVQAILPVLREDFAAIVPAESPEVLPPPTPEGVDAPITPTDPAAYVEGPHNRLEAGTFKLKNLGSEKATDVYFVGFTRSNAREGEDAILRTAGSTPAGTGVQLKAYEPATVESGTTGNLMATGGLQEIVWVAIPDNPDMPGMLTLYRLFRAPAGGPKSLLEMVGGVPVNLDSVQKIHTAGRPVLDGVIHFGVTFRNVFATSWTDGAGAGKVQDGSPYVGPIWDSTRATDPKFPMHKGKESLADVKDDVFPAMARIDLTLAIEGPYGFNRGEALVAAPVTIDDRRVALTDVEPLFRPGPLERFIKVDSEWMSVNAEATDFDEKRVTVGRGKRLTKAVEHRVDEPVYFGYPVTTDVTLLFKDRYGRR